MSAIHPTASIHPQAQLGAGVEVGAFAFIDAGATIGDDCRIGPHTTIHSRTTLGSGCSVHAGAVLGDLPQDLGFKGGNTFVRIGSGCVLREGVTVHRGTKEGTVTELGDHCYLMANAHVAHNCKVGSRVILANGTLLGGYAQIGDGAFISGNCLVHQFVRVGRVAMFGGGSGCSQDVPPFMTLRPLTSNEVLGLNIVGMRRAGITPADRLEIKRAFVMLYRSGLSVRDAVDAMRSELHSAVACELIDFVAASKRGVCRPRSDALEVDETDADA